MTSRTKVTFAAWCRGTRIDLDVTTQQLADAVGISRQYLCKIEAGRANPTLDVVDRIGDALRVPLEVVGPQPIVLGARQPGDRLHGWCSGFSQRRVGGQGLLTAREVEIVDRRTHGWIDLLAFDPRTGTMIIIELKTSLEDIGQIERQLGWYERLAGSTDIAREWRPIRTVSWLLVLATAEVDTFISRHKVILDQAFPVRAPAMRALLAGDEAPVAGRGLALIDPRRRGAEWLLPSRADGRRSPAPFADRAAAVAYLERPR